MFVVSCYLLMEMCMFYNSMKLRVPNISNKLSFFLKQDFTSQFLKNAVFTRVDDFFLKKGKNLRYSSSTHFAREF